MSSKTLLQPFQRKTLQKFLQKEISQLQEAPILVVASELPATGASPPVTPVSDAIQWVQFTLGQQYGLRTVSSTVSSVFPTQHDIESKSDMLRRTGSSSIVGVGSGAAMDLAKALAYENQMESLLLVPSTYAAVLASGASHSLLLDSVEETIVPFPSFQQTRNVAPDGVCPTTVAPLELKYTASLDAKIVVYSSLALVLDACFRKAMDPTVEELLQSIHDILAAGAVAPDKSLEISHEAALDLLYKSGSLISYGFSDDRSAPLALATSLIPTTFPDMHVLTFWANLVPGLCTVLEQKMPSSKTPSPALACLPDVISMVRERQGWADAQALEVRDETLQGFSVPDMALGHIQSNQTTWKCLDVASKDMISILRESLTK